MTAFPNATGPLSTAAGGPGPGYRSIYPGKDDLATQYFGYGVYLNNVPGNPLGETRQITQNITHQGTIGIKAELGGDWKLDGYFKTGDTRENYIDNNGTRVDRLFFAMDAVVPTHARRSGQPERQPDLPRGFADLRSDVLQELRGLRADQPVRRLEQHFAAGRRLCQRSAETGRSSTMT